jgi:autotransporter-associated beta strand protein
MNPNSNSFNLPGVVHFAIFGGASVRASRLVSSLARPNCTAINLRRMTVLFVLGMLSVSRSLAVSFEWTGATGADDLWATAGNWNPSGPPGTADSVIFGDTDPVADAFTVNNIVGANKTIAALSYTNSLSGTWHVTQIASGVTLTVSGAVIIGGGTGAGLNTSAAMTGGGTFLVTGSTNFLTLGNTTSSGSATPGTLDLSGLTTFVFNATNGTIGIGYLPSGTGSRSTGNLTLAAGSNSITTGTIDMNGATGTASTPTFNLGAGTNIIHANTFNVGGGRSTTTLKFYDVSGGLRLRGAGGTDADRTTMVVGNRNTGGTGTFNTSGNVLLNDHPVDLKLATLTLGLMSRTQAGTDAGKYQPAGVFEFNQGTVDATTVTMGVCSGNSTNAGSTGTLTVGAAGTLLAGNISLANMSLSPTNNCTARGTLTIAGGVVNCAGSIFKTSVTGSTGIVAVTSGALSVGGSMGSPTNALDSLSLSEATLTFRADVPAPVTVTALDTGGSTNLINISSVPTITGYPAQLQVIKYTGTIGGAGFDNNVGLGTLPTVSPAYAGYLSNNTANTTIDVVITNGPPPSRSLTWNGIPTGDWNTTTANWRVSGSSTTYNQNDTVLFDDTAAGTTVVNLTTTLMPVSLTVSNATRNYTFTGAGSVSGSVGLTKQGAGLLTLANTGSNDFTGPVIVAGGTLQIGSASNPLPTNSAVVLSNTAGAMLDLNNLDLTIGSLNGGGDSGGNVSLGTGALSINGGGGYAGVIGGAGKLVKSGTGTVTFYGANLYTGGTLINTGTVVVANSTGYGTGPGSVLIAGGTLRIGTNSTIGSIAPQPGGFLTNHGTLTFNRSDALTPLEIITGAGAVRHSGSGLLIFNHDNTYTNTTTVDRNNGALRISTPNALGTLDGGTTVSGGNGTPVNAGGQLEMSGSVVFAPERLTLGCRGTSTFAWVGPSQFVNQNGTNTWTGPIDITTGGSYIALQSDSGLMRIQGSIAGGPTATSTRMLVLRGAADGEISGVISNGPVTTALSLCKGDSGTWTLSGNNLYTGSTTVTNTGTLRVNGAIGGSGVDVVGGTLGGTGLITAAVAIEVNGRLAPGAPIGTLTVSNALALSGTTEMEVSPTAADKVQGLTSVTFGGTLKVVVVGNLTGTEVFKLFDAAPGGYAGDFATYDLPTLSAPLAWDTTSVPLDGTLRVAGGVERPHVGTITRTSDGNFQLTGTGPGTASYRILATANVGLPLTNWVQVSSGNFTGGAFSFTDLNATNYPLRFYSVVTP